MKKVIGIAVMMLVVYSVSLLATLPMSLVLQHAPLPKQLKLGKIEGSLWQGEAQSVEYENLQLSAVTWDLSAWALLLGKVKADVSFEDLQNLQGEATFSYGFSGWRIDDAQVTAQANWVLTQVPSVVPVSAEGQLQLSLASAAQGQPWCEELQGQLQWQDASLLTPMGTMSFDDFRAPLSCDEGKLKAVLIHEDKQINLESSVLVDARSWKAEGKLKAGAQMPKALSSNMRFLGRADPQGFYRFTQQGRL